MLRAWLILVLWLAPISVEAKVGEFIGDDFLNQCTTANSDWTPRDTQLCVVPHTCRQTTSRLSKLAAMRVILIDAQSDKKA
jgi:hypothetical protein